MALVRLLMPAARGAIRSSGSALRTARIPALALRREATFWSPVNTKERLGGKEVDACVFWV